MGRMIAICVFELQRVFKQRKTWLLMFVMPLLFAFVFGSMSDSNEAGKTSLALVDEDRTLLAQELVQKLAANDMLTVQELPLQEANQELANQKIAGIVIIPSGYQQKVADSQPVDVSFQHGPQLAIAPAIAQTIAQATAKQNIQVQAARIISQKQAGAQSNSQWQNVYSQVEQTASTSQIAVQAENVTPSAAVKTLGNAQSVVGFSLMFLMISLLSVTGVLLDARKTGVWQRLLSTPVRRWQVMGGYLLSFFLTGWIQFGLLMVATRFLFHVHWGNLPGQILLVSAMILCIVGLGLFMAGLVKSTEQQTALGSLVIVSTSMLGGVYWPLDIVSGTMKTIAKFVPQSWAMQGFTELMVRGGTVGDIRLQVLVLLGFAAVFLLAGMTRVRYE